jgi:non-heme chloroperoxidase
MKKRIVWIVALVMLSAGLLRAQDIAGSWQGTLEGTQKLRAVVKISKVDDGEWKAMLYSIDQGTDGMAVSSASLAGTTFRFSVDPIHGSYEGTLGPDGNTITGTWTQGGKTNPLTLVRATKETAWAIDFIDAYGAVRHGRQGCEAGSAGLGRHGASADLFDRSGE